MDHEATVAVGKRSKIKMRMNSISDRATPADSLPIEPANVPPPDATLPPVTLHRVITPGIVAVKRLWLPFVVLQACGLAVVIAYFRVAAVREACDALAEVKRRGGFAFSSVAMSLCGGLLPELCKFAVGTDRRLNQKRWRDTLFVMALYAFTGILSDGLYRILAYTCGDGVGIGRIAAKVAIDQFIYTPTVGVGTIALAFAWRRYGYDALRVLREINGRWYLLTVVPLLLPAWAYWIPMTSFMYALPASLTFVYGAIATAAISLLFTTIVTSEHEGAK